MKECRFHHRLVVQCVVIAVLLSTGVSADQVQSSSGVRIMAPESGYRAAQSEKLQVMIVAGVDDISGVCILCDDKGIALLDKPPFSAILDTTPLALGNHILKAVACRTNGDKIASEAVQFTIGQSSATAPAADGAKAVLPAGIAVHLRTVEKLANGVTPVGAVVNYVVAEDVLDSNNRILIRRGAASCGRCTESARPRMLGKGGMLSFTVDNVIAVDGTSVPLKLEQERLGKSETDGCVAMALTGCLSGLMASGHNVWVDAGTSVTAQVDKDTAVSPGAIRVNASKTPSGEIAAIQIAGRNRAARGGVVELRLSAEPKDKVKSVSVLLDSTELEKRDNSFDSLNVRIPTSASKGAHSIVVDVSFSDGYALESSAQLEIR